MFLCKSQSHPVDSCWEFCKSPRHPGRLRPFANPIGHWMYLSAAQQNQASAWFHNSAKGFGPLRPLTWALTCLTFHSSNWCKWRCRIVEPSPWSFFLHKHGTNFLGLHRFSLLVVLTSGSSIVRHHYQPSTLGMWWTLSLHSQQILAVSTINQIMNDSIHSHYELAQETSQTNCPSHLIQLELLQNAADLAHESGNIPYNPPG